MTEIDGNEALVSIIIPTYNRGDLIKDTVDSVLNQSHKNFEILICDDGSTDNTEKIISNFKDSRIRFLKIEHSGLPAKARNCGIQNSKGNFIAFLDSDDQWFPEKLRVQLNAFKIYPKALAISTNKIDFPGESEIELKLNKNIILDFEEILKKNLIYNSSVMIRKEVVEKIGFLDESHEVRAAEDYDYWLRILYFQNNSIILLKEPLLKYRVHSSMLSELDVSRDYYMHYFERRQFIYKKFKNFNQNKLKKILKNHYSLARSVQIRFDLKNNKISMFEAIYIKGINFIHRIKLILHYLLIK